VTQQEHWLVIGALAQQMQLSLMILDILKTRDIISDDDVPAFASLAKLAPGPSIQHVAEAYLAVGRALGLELTLTPPLPV
jgi:chromate transport protein ChrA